MFFAHVQFIPGVGLSDWTLEIDGATHKRILQNQVSDIREAVEECGIAWDEVNQIRLDDPSGIFYEVA